MQTSNHYSSAHSASLHRQAAAAGLFGVVIFFLPLFYFIFKLDLLIPPGNLRWILFIITFFLSFLYCFAQSQQQGDKLPMKSICQQSFL